MSIVSLVPPRRTDPARVDVSVKKLRMVVDDAVTPATSITAPSRPPTSNPAALAMLPAPTSLRVAPSTLNSPAKPVSPVRFRVPPLTFTALEADPEKTPAKLSVAKPLTISSVFPAASSTRPAPDSDLMEVTFAVCGGARSRIPSAPIRMELTPCKPVPDADSVLSRPASIEMSATLASPVNESVPVPALINLDAVTLPETDAMPVVSILASALVPLLSAMFAA